MRSLPETPGQEFAISLAGPLFNIALTIILFFPLKYLLGTQNLFHPNPHTWAGAIAYAYWVNPILAGFNLLPAFPMDGGRILRSLLARKFSYIKATKIAVGFGHIFALMFAFVALSSSPPNFILLLIALFIFVAASQEEAIAGLRATLSKIRIRDILSESFYTVSPDALIGEVLELVFHTHQEDFPVTVGSELVGFLPRNKILSAMHEKQLDKRVQELMLTDFPTLTPDEFLSTAYNKMENAGLKALPVIEKGILKGIVTLEDISRLYTLLKEE